MCDSNSTPAAASAAAAPAWLGDATAFATRWLPPTQPNAATAREELTRLIDALLRECGAATLTDEQKGVLLRDGVTSSVGTESKDAPVASAPTASSSAAAAVAPLLPPASAVAAAPSPLPSPSTPATASSNTPALTNVLASVADASLLVPKGKFRLDFTPSHLHLTNPTSAAKSLALQWRDVDCVFDLPDANKRDWLTLLVLRPDSAGLTVGKKAHHAIVVKSLASEKIKPGRISVSASEDEPIAAQLRSLIGTEQFRSGQFAAALLAMLRAMPPLSGAQFIAGESSIFSSVKQLPCVGCKYGVEDGALYFLRTGLLFVKPVIYLPIARIDGITPARGKSSTFDMKVGVEGQKAEVEFQMIDPKEEGSITRYCQFLGQEQAKIEREEKRKKEAAAAGGGAAAAANSAASSTPAAPAASSAPPASSALTSPPASLIVDEISAANVIAGPRPARAAKPRSFAGMDDAEEEAEEQQQRERKRKRDEKQQEEEESEAEEEAESGSGSDSDSASGSSDDDEWSEPGSDSDSSDDSAEYDSAADEKEYNSDDERQKQQAKRRKRSSDDSDSEAEADKEGETEAEDAGASPTVAPSSAAASSSSSSSSSAAGASASDAMLIE